MTLSIKSSTFNQVLRQLNELTVNTENNEAVLFCYLLAQLNIRHSNNLSVFDGINTSAFSAAAANYGIAESLPEYIHDVRFIAFCRTLLQYNLHTDYYSFFEHFTPHLVSQWEQLNLVAGSYSVLDFSALLYLTLIETNRLDLDFNKISHKAIIDVYKKVTSHVTHLELSVDTFVQIWESVFYIPMPKLNVTFSKKLIETVKFYRTHKDSSCFVA